MEDEDVVMCEEVREELEALQSFMYGDAAAYLTVTRCRGWMPSHAESEDVVEERSGGLNLSVWVELLVLPEATTLCVGQQDVSVASLPRLNLRVHMPEGYPLKMATFEVSCVWLSLRQLSIICEHLDRLYEECGGAGTAVVLQWVSHAYLWLWPSECILSVSSPNERIQNKLLSFIRAVGSAAHSRFAGGIFTRRVRGGIRNRKPDCLQPAGRAG